MSKDDIPSCMIPKPTPKKKNPYKTTSRRQERTLAKKVGGKRVPLSGGGEIKGDVLSDNFIFECKTSHLLTATGEKQINLKKDWLTKIEKESEGKRIPIVEFRFKNDHSAYYVLSEATMMEMIKRINDN